MASLVAFPNAKINLGLQITGKRSDGYHDLESCFYPIPWHDSLEVAEAASFSFQSYGLPIPGDTENNLCVKAYQLLAKDFDIPPVAIHLIKHIPMGAGLGGGSADGSFLLKLIHDLFDLKLSNDTLERYALMLGSDCPFFIENQPAIATGRGDVLRPISLDLTSLYLAICNPGIHISTQEAFAGITISTAQGQEVEQIIRSPIASWKGALENEFEKSIFPNHPEIADLKQEMYNLGAVYASMTGSGSTVFGIFDAPIEKQGWKCFAL